MTRPRKSAVAIIDGINRELYDKVQESPRILLPSGDKAKLGAMREHSATTPIRKHLEAVLDADYGAEAAVWGMITSLAVYADATDDDGRPEDGGVLHPCEMPAWLDALQVVYRMLDGRIGRLHKPTLERMIVAMRENELRPF